jgi:hypothetical protein
MSQFKQGEFAKIVYLSETKDELSQRTIIPTFVPRQTMKSIDVSELTAEQKAEMQALYKEYARYYEEFLINAFNFETWVEHTKGKTISPKWRAFKLANIKETL